MIDKRTDLIRTIELAEHFLRSGLARNVSPIDMAEAWSRIHRLREALMQETESLPPITSALEHKDGPPAPYRHQRKP